MPSIQKVEEENSLLQSQHIFDGSSSLLLSDKYDKIRRYNTPPLLSSSIRARSSPKLIHGNSPLLQSWDADHEIDALIPSRGQFEDADYDDSILDSPSSRILQEQLRNAIKAVKELQEAVENQRNRRESLKSLTLKDQSDNSISTNAVIIPHSGMTMRVRNEKQRINCLSGNNVDLNFCKENGAAIGLGLNIPSGKILKRTSSSIELLTSSHHQAEFPMMAPELSKRNSTFKEEIACNTPVSAVARSSKTFTRASEVSAPSMFAPDHTSTPLQMYSPNTILNTPTTPTIEATANTVPMISTPQMTRTTDSATGQSQTGNAGNANTKSSSAFQYSSSHGVSNTLIAVASVSAAGSLIVLAAILYTLIKLRRRRQHHRQKMNAVLNKVSSHPTSKDAEADDSIDGMAEKRDSDHHDDVFIIGAESNSKEHLKRNTKAKSTSDLTCSPPKELEMISPWLSYDMPGHPFANISSAPSPSDRYSPDLAYTGIVGHETSKDQSFNWNYPKLSVPPAAARAMGTSHYVKKRMTLPRKSVTSHRLSTFATDTYSRSAPSSTFNLTSTQSSTGNESVAQDIRTSTSSEVIDPEIDHLRRSFCTTRENSGALVNSSAWIQSAKSIFGSRQEVKMLEKDVAVDDGDISRREPDHSSSRRHSDASIFGKSVESSSEAHQQLHRDLGLPCLSIANSPIVDARETTLLSRKTSKTRWTRPVMPPRIFSSESEDSHSYRDRTSTRYSRRLSHSEALQQQALSKINSAEIALPRTTETEAEEVKESEVVVIDRALHRFNWTQEMTDTEDESREGYEAEQETETEIESELPHSKLISEVDTRKVDQVHSGDVSTPVITLTSSEEEGQFERRISLTSSIAHSISSQGQEDGTISAIPNCSANSYINLVDAPTSNDEVEKGEGEEEEEEDEDVTVICHSLHSRGSISDNSSISRSDQPDEVNCLLSDDFPTIPEWIPIQDHLRHVNT